MMFRSTVIIFGQCFFAASEENGGAKCVLQSVQFQVDQKPVYTEHANSMACSGKGTCVVRPEDAMVSDTPPSYPPGSIAVLHSLSDNLRRYNGKLCTVLEHDVNEDLPRVKVQVGEEVLWVNTNYLMPQLKRDSRVRFTIWTKTEIEVSSSFAQTSGKEEGEYTVLDEDDADYSVGKVILIQAHQVVKSLRDLLPSKVQYHAEPPGAGAGGGRLPGGGSQISQSQQQTTFQNQMTQQQVQQQIQQQATLHTNQQQGQYQNNHQGGGPGAFGGRKNQQGGNHHQQGGNGNQNQQGGNNHQQGGGPGGDESRSTAATSIQKMMRGYSARQQMNRQQTAAQNIQRATRGYTARQQVGQLRKQEHAAEIIQKMMRGHLSRQETAQLREQVLSAVTAIQGMLRGKSSRQETSQLVEKLSTAARAIQGALQGHAARASVQAQHSVQAQQSQQELAKTISQFAQQKTEDAEMAQQIGSLVTNVISEMGIDSGLVSQSLQNNMSQAQTAEAQQMQEIRAQVTEEVTKQMKQDGSFKQLEQVAEQVGKQFVSSIAPGLDVDALSNMKPQEAIGEVTAAVGEQSFLGQMFGMLGSVVNQAQERETQRRKQEAEEMRRQMEERMAARVEVRQSNVQYLMDPPTNDQRRRNFSIPGHEVSADIFDWAAKDVGASADELREEFVRRGLSKKHIQASVPKMSESERELERRRELLEALASRQNAAQERTHQMDFQVVEPSVTPRPPTTSASASAGLMSLVLARNLNDAEEFLRARTVEEFQRMQAERAAVKKHREQRDREEREEFLRQQRLQFRQEFEKPLSLEEVTSGILDEELAELAAVGATFDGFIRTEKSIEKMKQRDFLEKSEAVAHMAEFQSDLDTWILSNQQSRICEDIKKRLTDAETQLKDLEEIPEKFRSASWFREQMLDERNPVGIVLNHPGVRDTIKTSVRSMVEVSITNLARWDVLIRDDVANQQNVESPVGSEDESMSVEEQVPMSHKESTHSPVNLKESMERYALGVESPEDREQQSTGMSQDSSDEDQDLETKMTNALGGLLENIFEMAFSGEDGKSVEETCFDFVRGLGVEIPEDVEQQSTDVSQDSSQGEMNVASSQVMDPPFEEDSIEHLIGRGKTKKEVQVLADGKPKFQYQPSPQAKALVDSLVASGKQAAAEAANKEVKRKRIADLRQRCSAEFTSAGLEKIRQVEESRIATIKEAAADPASGIPSHEISSICESHIISLLEAILNNGDSTDVFLPLFVFEYWTRSKFAEFRANIASDPVGKFRSVEDIRPQIAICVNDVPESYKEEIEKMWEEFLQECDQEGVIGREMTMHDQISLIANDDFAQQGALQNEVTVDEWRRNAYGLLIPALKEGVQEMVESRGQQLRLLTGHELKQGFMQNEEISQILNHPNLPSEIRESFNIAIEEEIKQMEEKGLFKGPSSVQRAARFDDRQYSYESVAFIDGMFQSGGNNHCVPLFESESLEELARVAKIIDVACRDGELSVIHSEFDSLPNIKSYGDWYHWFFMAAIGGNLMVVQYLWMVVQEFVAECTCKEEINEQRVAEILENPIKNGDEAMTSELVNILFSSDMFEHPENIIHGVKVGDEQKTIMEIAQDGGNESIVNILIQAGSSHHETSELRQAALNDERECGHESDDSDDGLHQAAAIDTPLEEEKPREAFNQDLAAEKQSVIDIFKEAFNKFGLKGTQLLTLEIAYQIVSEWESEVFDEASLSPEQQDERYDALFRSLEEFDAWVRNCTRKSAFSKDEIQLEKFARKLEDELPQYELVDMQGDLASILKIPIHYYDDWLSEDLGWAPRKKSREEDRKIASSFVQTDTMPAATSLQEQTSTTPQEVIQNITPDAHLATLPDNVKVEDFLNEFHFSQNQAISSINAAESAFNSNFKTSKNHPLLTNAKDQFFKQVELGVNALANVWANPGQSEDAVENVLNDFSDEIDEWFEPIGIKTPSKDASKESAILSYQNEQISSISKQYESRKELIIHHENLGGLLPLNQQQNRVQPYKYSTKRTWRLGHVIKFELDNHGYSWAYVQELGTNKVLLVNVLQHIKPTDKEYIFFERVAEIRFALEKADQSTSFIQPLRSEGPSYINNFSTSLIQYSNALHGQCKCNPGMTGKTCNVYINPEDDPNHNPKLKWWVILVIVLSSVGVLIVLITIGCCINSKRQTEKTRKAEEETIAANNAERTVNLQVGQHVDTNFDVVDPAVVEVTTETHEEESPVNLHIPATGSGPPELIPDSVQVVDNFGIYHGHNSKLQDIVGSDVDVPLPAVIRAPPAKTYQTVTANVQHLNLDNARQAPLSSTSFVSSLPQENEDGDN